MEDPQIYVPVFMPHNEPYLGRETLFAFDNLIVACLDANTKVAPLTHKLEKSDLQRAACQLIPQSISIALSVRELVRQGYLFGAKVLIRSLAERAAILLYLLRRPEEVEKWKRGWKHNEAPSLAQMFEEIGGDKFPGIGREVTRPFNSIVHGKPDCAVWSLVDLGEGQLGHSVSKNTNNPNLCDEVCMEASAWLATVMAMMSAYFPEAFTSTATTD